MSRLNLIVGCGGSGLTTLKNLNRLLAQNPETLPRMGTDVYYLAVDTDAGDLQKFEDEIKLQMGEYDPPFIQRIQLSDGVNILNEIVKPNFVDPFKGKGRNSSGLERLRKHWWFDAEGNPFNGHQIKGNLCDGAGQCPPASYGLAWFHLKTIGDAVARIVDRMVECGYGNASQLKEMNLAVVAGLSGGTGRGCWNLIMFKIREYLLKNYKVMVPPVGIFFDSSVFASVASENEGQKTPLKVNALTGLSELSCWIRNGSAVGTRRVEYRVPSMKTPSRPETDVLQVDLEINPNGGTPVSNAYLIFGRNGGAAILGNNTQYHEMAGAGLYSMIVNPQLRARQINDGDPVNSFGAATFEVDTIHIRSYFETRARRMALDSLASEGESAAGEVDAFLEANPVVPNARTIEELRPDPKGSILQRAVAALFAGRTYVSNFASMESKFQNWTLAQAKETVGKVLRPASEAALDEAVKTALASYALDGDKLTDKVIEEMEKAFGGEGGKEPSVARARSFLETIKARIAKAGVNVGELSKLETEAAKAGSATDVMWKTLEVFSHRSPGEKIAVWKHIGPFNADEKRKLIEKDGSGEYWGIVPQAVAAVNIGKLKVAFDKAFQNTIKRIDNLLKACDQFKDCCREVAESFALEEIDSAGGKSGGNAFAKLFSTPDDIEETLYDDNSRERFYHRILRPIFRDPKDMETTIKEESKGEDGVEIRSYRIDPELMSFISSAVKGGLLEALAGGSDRAKAKARKSFVDELTEVARGAVRLSDSFMERHFTFERILDRNREFWNEAYNKAAGSKAKTDHLDSLFLRTLGTKPQKDPKHLNDPATLPPTEELLQSVGTSLVSTCAPWWDADTEGAHHSILLFVPFDLSSKKEAFKKFIAEKAAHVEKVSPYGTNDVNSGVTPFGYVAFSAAGVKLTEDEASRNKELENEPEKQTFLFDKIGSLANDCADPDVSTWLRKAEDPDGESIFSEENYNKGIGYVSPMFVHDKKLSAYRWKPWMRDDEAAAAAAENQVADLLLYALLGTGLPEAQAKEFEAKLAPYGWSLPAIRLQEKGQKWLLSRKTFAWDEDEGKAVPNTECAWNKGQLLCTSVCNLDSMLRGRGCTGKNGAARPSDVEKGNKLKALLATEAAVFAERIAADLGSDLKKLVKARKDWLVRLRDDADAEDRPVYDRLLKRSAAK